LEIRKSKDYYLISELSNFKKQILGFQEGWKTGRLEEVLVFAIFPTSTHPTYLKIKNVNLLFNIA